VKISRLGGLLAALFLIPAGCSKATSPTKEAVAAAPPASLTQAAPGHTALTWFGQSYFLLTTAAGVRIAVDPFPPSLGYTEPAVTADVVLVTHDHFDHNAVDQVHGNFRQIFAAVGVVKVRGITVTGVRTYHDEKQGQERGPNTVYVIEADGIRFCHLGDLGHLLTPEQLKQIGKVDVLMIPVGGFFTIDAAKATQVAAQLKPRIIVPMHYRTEALRATPNAYDYLNEAQAFLEGKNVKSLKSNTVYVTVAGLPKTPVVYVPDYRWPPGPPPSAGP
jgi:L-ascorbate metabolism protein UlaG (beta-lactamase superfamily)